LSVDSAFWRRLAWLGAAHGPRPWLRYSPVPIGLAFALVSGRQRRHVRANLRALMGERPRWQEHVDVALTFARYAQSLAETLALSGDHRNELRVDADDAARLGEVIAEGRGVVLVTAHTAGWEIALAGLRRWVGTPVFVAMTAEPDPAARRFHPIVGDDDAVRVVVVRDDPLGVLPLLGHLRKGGIVAVQVDRCPTGMRGRMVKAGGRSWVLPTGPFLLAAASGAPLVPVFTRRLGFFRYQLQFAPLVRVPPKAVEHDLTRAAEEVARSLAAFVVANPTQWFDFAGP
jgi:KDO2-lipid IV(A) lauroyltransferase